jgi:translocation and assembly module TamB
MSNTRQVPPDPSGPDQENREQPLGWHRRYVRHVLWGGAGLALLLTLGMVGLYLWASSSSFENIVRTRLIARIEAATGGRAEIGSFHWKLLKLEFEADDVVLHGREAAGEAPFA